MPPRTSAPVSPPALGVARPAGESGIALLIVLLLSAVLIPFAADFAYQIQMESSTAQNVSDQLAIDNAIEGQYQIMLARFRFDGMGNESDSYDDAWNDAEALSRTEAETGVSISTHVADEKAKFNLRMLAEGTPERQGVWKERFARLIEYYRLDTKWDAGGVSEELAEDIQRYMKGQGRGEIPKPQTLDDRAMLVIDELAFVNEQVERDQLLVDRREEDEVAHGLHRYVTLQGDGRVNLNTAPEIILRAMFPHDPVIAERIIERREGSGEDEDVTTDDEAAGAGNPFTNVDQVNEIEGVTQEVLRNNKVVLAQDFDVLSNHFSMRIVAETERTTRSELFIFERVPGEDPNGEIEGFRHLLCQARTDPLEETEEDFEAAEERERDLDR